jgi:hypothetical protein
VEADESLSYLHIRRRLSVLLFIYMVVKERWREISHFGTGVNSWLQRVEVADPIA